MKEIRKQKKKRRKINKKAKGKRFGPAEKGTHGPPGIKTRIGTLLLLSSR
jgi:hypothetical protein